MITWLKKHHSMSESFTLKKAHTTHTFEACWKKLKLSLQNQKHITCWAKVLAKANIMLLNKPNTMLSFPKTKANRQAKILTETNPASKQLGRFLQKSYRFFQEFFSEFKCVLMRSSFTKAQWSYFGDVSFDTWLTNRWRMYHDPQFPKHVLV